MTLTQEEILHYGYKIPAAPPDAWRSYDEANPIPGYFQFDWLSSRHPDLYHKFALSTVGLMQKLHSLVDLAGCEVLDIGAGTGRSAVEAAKKAKAVFAVDAFESVVFFGKEQLQKSNIPNVHYINASRDHLPVQANAVDVILNSWAELNPREAYRVLRPDGTLIQLGAVPNALCGELTSELAPDYAWIPQDCAPPAVFEPGYPETHGTADNSIWDGIPVAGPIHVHQFTYVADYQDASEAAAMFGRLYGPKAKRYFLTRGRATFSWRLQIIIGRVRK